MRFDFNKKITSKMLSDFADLCQDINRKIGFKVSARGWCYLMEQAGYIDKSQFPKVESAINRCRKEGHLPVDFVRTEDARLFQGVEEPSEKQDKTIEDILDWMLRDVLNGSKYYTPNWWEGEEYYIQMVVEKVDLVTLFEPVCKEYHIPIANAKGWSSILQRAEYARRFAEAEEMGLKCVLLYCGDHDPDGLRISDTIRKNIVDVSAVVWEDGMSGYYPDDLIIHRFGLNYDFIIANDYTWIDNLITGSGMNLADPKHKNYKLPYVKQYLREIGERKCEANAIVTSPRVAEQLVRSEIENWLGSGARDRFKVKRYQATEDYKQVLKDSELEAPIVKFLNR